MLKILLFFITISANAADTKCTQEIIEKCNQHYKDYKQLEACITDNVKKHLFSPQCVEQINEEKSCKTNIDKRCPTGMQNRPNCIKISIKNMSEFCKEYLQYYHVIAIFQDYCEADIKKFCTVEHMVEKKYNVQSCLIAHKKSLSQKCANGLSRL